MKVTGAAVAVLAMTGALALPATAGATIDLSTPIPKPGSISATVFKVVVKLAREQHPPDQLSIAPIDRRSLPRGVAVVGTARLLVYSPRDAAAYVGIVATYRSKTVDATGPDQPSEDASWRLRSEFLEGDYAPKVITREFTEAPVGEWTALLAPPTTDFEGAAAALASNETYNEVHAVSWDADQRPTETVDADAALGSTEESLIDNQLNPGLVGDIELALNARFVREFPLGSLDGDPTWAPPR